MKFHTLCLSLVAGASAVAAFPHAVEHLAARTYQTESSVCGTGMSVEYIVQGTDTLTRIAMALSSGICDIVKVNNIENPDLIFANQTLVVPVKLTKPDNDSCLDKSPEATATCVQNGPATVTVAPGDIIKDIAKKLGITTDSLLGANPGVDQFNLQKGQVLKVPVCAPPSPAMSPVADRR